MLERAALIADGIEPIEAQAEAGNASVKAAEDAVVKITAELRQIEAERQQANGNETAIYTKAIELLAGALAQKDLQRLYQDALRTPAKEDDELVMSIGKTREALQKADAEVSQIRAQIREMSRRRSELEGARDRARNSGFDSPMGNYGGAQDVITQVIGGILQGALRGTIWTAFCVTITAIRYLVPTRILEACGEERHFPRHGGVRTLWNRSRGSGGWRTGGSF